MYNTGYVFLTYILPQLGCISLSKAGGTEVEREERKAQLSDNALHVSWPFSFSLADKQQKQSVRRNLSPSKSKKLGVMKTLLSRKLQQRRRERVEDCVHQQIGNVWLNALICEFDAMACVSAHVIIRLQLGPVFLHHVKYLLEPFKVAHGVCHALYLRHKREAPSWCCPYVCPSMYSSVFEQSLFNFSDIKQRK